MKLFTRASHAVVALVAACACASGRPAAPPHPPDEAQPSAAEASEPAKEEAPAPAEAACGDKTCVPPEQCIRYYGIAGPSIPLYTCGQPCGEQGECPSGLSCATIADGPRLCR
jgi:hypothetical protein